MENEGIERAEGEKDERKRERERGREGKNESGLRHRCRRYILQEDLVISKLVIRLFDKTIFFTYERAFRRTSQALMCLIKM